jgi:hypothetical protein
MKSNYFSLTLVSFMVFLSGQNLLAQEQKRVTGRVMDSQSELLIGVNVSEVGNEKNGTTTGVDGTYAITVRS